jgi:hypothetical protein
VSPRTRRALGAITAAASLAFLAALSRVPYAAEPGADALLRLAWRARGERVEQCRRLTPAELARVPAHMRQEIQCTGRIVPYRLRVALDGREVINELVQAAGARHDRPLYVFRELRVPPGPHALAVRFARVRTVPATARDDETTTPPELRLDTAVLFLSRRAALVTYDEEQRRLTLIAAPRPPPPAR